MSTESEGPREARAEESASALNRDILDGLTTLVKQAGAVGNEIADDFNIARHNVLAIFKLDCGLPMKELAQRMGCDASFVTAIADDLEKRGFLRREPCPDDRRVKYLTLTEEGLAARDRMTGQIAAKMPWGYALNEEERSYFLTLVRKMIDTPSPVTCPGDEAESGV